MNPHLRRLILDLGPLLVFFVAFKLWGFFPATAIFMAAMLASIGFCFWRTRKLSPMPVFTAAMVLIFGGLTLYLRDETFLKVKVTIIYGFFGLVLLAGLALNHLFIKYVFEQAFELTEAGWRKLTLRWGIFFLVLAGLNEAVWRNCSTSTWVAFKVWGVIPLIFLFALAQTPLVMKHQSDKDAA